ncbi:GNAT family N-acetyltransferase [Patulibacter sp.]|uniref:GNAT family N-acetyltransferase n=1 Tax=Patulibacter sp. TaxID=1912859 RepID=UPI0027293774|nr:GNAT family N-acetyltransferase [Patulibacter sp.]MDO9410895.1 GNAT family N-acetyltransferase [Patulibacter sp.]
MKAATHRTTDPRSADLVGTSRHTLSTGEPVLVRDVVPGDEARLLGLLEHVTGDSRWFRFFTGGADIHKAAAIEARGDGDRGPGVLVLSGDGATVLGHGMCVDAGGGEAEVAFEVADGHHRRGVGGIMLQHLLVRARADGFTGVVAEVLPSNRDMLDLLASSGRELRSTTAGGIRSVRITLAPAPRAPASAAAPVSSHPVVPASGPPDAVAPAPGGPADPAGTSR